MLRYKDNGLFLLLIGDDSVMLIEGCMKTAIKELKNCLLFVCLFVCFPGVTTHCGCIFTAR